MDKRHPDSSAEGRDLVLLRRVAREDRDAFRELYERFHGSLFRFIYRITHSYPATEELVNDIMLLLWRNAGSFRGESKVSTWVFGIAYRQSMRYLSRDRGPLMRSIDAVSEELTEPDTSDAENWVHTGLEALPDAQRVTAMLVFYLGLTYEEVSCATNCPVSTVKTRMFHARRKLRKILPVIAEPNAAVS